jgi:very-short-patch-repair endonuclease
VVEIDGPDHDDESDRWRDKYLESQGFRVVRFPAGDVDESLDDVIDAIYYELQSPHPAVPFGQGRPPRRAGR